MEFRMTSLLFITTMLAVYCDFVEGTVFLERGQQGVVPCPLIKSGRYAAEETEVMYWYLGQPESKNLLISSFRGQVAPQNGIPDGVYDINNHFSLVIINVTEPYEETHFFYKYKPKLRMVEDGHVIVSEKVCPKPPSPSVIVCDQRPSEPAACDALNPFGASSYALICLVNNVKPPVNISWFRETEDGHAVVDASQIVNRSLDSVKNTFTSSAAIQLASLKDDEVFTCEAHGVALPDPARKVVSFSKIRLVEMQTSSSAPLKTDANVTNEYSAMLFQLKQDNWGAALIVFVVLTAFSIIVIIVLSVTVMKLKMKLKKKSMWHLAPTAEPRV